MPSLEELAKIIRSKNAKPFVLTIDVLFDGKEPYDRVVRSGALTPEEVAVRFHVVAADVQVFPYPAAYAIKVTFPRQHPAGSFEDCDLIGAQQATPILDLEIP
jgi:hypothetical protein